MAAITLGGTPTKTNGNLPKVGEKAPNFTLRRSDLSKTTLEDYKGKKLILNIFPSIATGVCATSVRNFNQKASALENTQVLCISKDLPFAHESFCATEGIKNTLNLSDLSGAFGEDYQVKITDGAFEDLFSRAIVVIDTAGNIAYTEQVSEIGNEPNYEAAINAASL